VLIKYLPTALCSMCYVLCAIKGHFDIGACGQWYRGCHFCHFGPLQPTLAHLLSHNQTNTEFCIEWRAAKTKQQPRNCFELRLGACNNICPAVDKTVLNYPAQIPLAGPRTLDPEPRTQTIVVLSDEFLSTDNYKRQPRSNKCNKCNQPAACQSLSLT